MSGWAVDAHDDAIVIEDRVQPERWLVVLVLKLHAAIHETDYHHQPTKGCCLDLAGAGISCLDGYAATEARRQILH